MGVEEGETVLERVLGDVEADRLMDHEVHGTEAMRHSVSEEGSHAVGVIVRDLLENRWMQTHGHLAASQH